MKQADTGKRPLYYGWYIVFTCMFIVLLTNGVRNSFTVFIIPMETDFGWSRGTTSVAASVALLVSAVIQPFAGRIFDSLGGRKVLLSSMVVLGLATVLLSFTFNFIFLVLVFGVVFGIAISGVSLSNTMALLSRWFRRNRGTATGINATGLAAGGLLMVLLAAYLMQATNWRTTWAILGMLILGLGVPIAYLFLRNDPSQMGLLPDGDIDTPDERSRGLRNGCLAHWKRTGGLRRFVRCRSGSCPSLISFADLPHQSSRSTLCPSPLAKGSPLDWRPLFLAS